MKSIRFVCGLAALAAAGLSAYAQGLSLGINFASTDPDAASGSLLPEEVAGVVPRANWNNLTGALYPTDPPTAAPTLVYDDNGTAVASSVTITYTSPNTWRSAPAGGTGNNNFPAGPDRKLLTGYLDSTDLATGGINISVAGLDPALAAAGYDVYVYFVSDSNANRGGAYTLNAGNGPIVKYGSTLGTPSAYVEDPGNDINLSADGTHLRFVGNFGTSFTLTTDASVTTPNGFRAPINAIQIVPTPQFGPEFATNPRGVTVYEGRTARFSAVATGFPAVTTYQWNLNGTPLTESARVIGVATPNLTIDNVTAADVGDYTLTATSTLGSSPSAAARLNVVAPDGSLYEAAVITAAPLSYWRLNDNIESLLAADYIGARTGLYTEGTIHGEFVPGPIPPEFPGFTAANAAAQFQSASTYVTVPTPALGVNTATIIAWINPAAPQLEYSGIFMTREGTAAGLHFTTGNQLGYTWNNNTTWSWNSGLVPPANAWTMVAIVIQPDKATLFMGANGALTAAINPIAHTAEAWGGGARIGDDSSAINRVFNGLIDEVAFFNRALSYQDIATLYEGGTGIPQVVPPVISPHPRSADLYAGGSVVFRSGAAGANMTLRWTKNGAPLDDSARIAGSSTDTLTITGVTADDAGDYRLTASNTSGTTLSDPATLAVLTPENQYVTDILALNPLSYWRLNETGDVSAGTLVAHDRWNARDGTYGAAAQPGVEGPNPAAGYGNLETGNTANNSRLNTANSWVNVPAPGITTDTMTFLAWINPVTRVNNSGIIFARAGQPATGMILAGAGNLGYSWRDVNLTYNFNSGLTPPLNQWSMVAVVVEPTQATLYMFNANGSFSAVNTTPHAARAFTDTSMRIGNDQNNNNRTFNGRIDEAAIFNTALTGAQLQTLYTDAVGSVAPTIVANPVSRTEYPGASATFSVSASGTEPVTFRWEKFVDGAWVPVSNGGNVSGADTRILTITALTAENAGEYRAIATNAQGNATSNPGTLTVLPTPPAPADGTFGGAVTGSGPLVYYRFEEEGDPTSGALQIFDYSGNNRHALYGTASINGLEGPRPPDFALFEEDNSAFASTLNLANSWATAPALIPDGNTQVNVLTLIAWIRPTTRVNNAGIVFWRAGQPATGLNLSGIGNLGYHWRDAAATYNFASGITPPIGEWSMVAVVVEPNQATLHMINAAGAVSAVNTADHAVRAFTDTARIGGDPNNANRTFDGAIDEVAVFGMALNAQQIQGIYNGQVAEFAATVSVAQTAPGQITISWDGPGTVYSSSTIDAVTGWTPEPSIQNGVPFSVPAGAGERYYVVRR